MRILRKWAAVFTGVYAVSALTGVHAMAGQDAIRIDMTDQSGDAWAKIAMANDDTVETGVNIRKSANTDSEIAGFLYRGGAVYVLNKGDAWSEVTSGSVTGYIRNEYLTYGEEAKGLAEHYGSYGVKASWNDVNIFSGESGDSKIIQKASDGDTFRVVGKNGSWMQLQAGDQSAYVPAEDVSLVMVVDSAVAVDEAPDSEDDSVFTPVAGTVEAAVSSAERSESVESTAADSAAAAEAAYTGYEQDSYTEDAGSGAAAYEDNSSGESTSDAGWEAALQETGDTGSEEYSYEGTDGSNGWDESVSQDAGSTYETPQEPAQEYTQETAQAQEPAQTQETAPAEASADYSVPSIDTTVNTEGSAEELQAQANTLYQQYLDAQTAADNAVANGAGEQAINDTAAAAVEAYNTYLKAQNLADQAAWGYTEDTSSASGEAEQTSSLSWQEQADLIQSGGTYEETFGTQESADTSYDSSYEEPAAEETDTSSQSSVSDLDLLAALIYCEAGNQPYEGQVAVGAVVMNRVNSGSFPGSISEVINQSGQFTPSYTGVLAAALANGSGAAYTGAASEAMAGSDPTGGCLYFNNHQGSGLQIGDHWFF